MKRKWTPHIIAVTAFVVFIVLGLACATTAKAKDADLTYSEMVNVPGVSAEDLYMKANLWFTDTFKGPNTDRIPRPGFYIPEMSRIINADKNKGSIQAHYTFLTDEQDLGSIYQIIIIYSTVEIQVSDGQYRLSFSNPRTAANTFNNGAWTYAKPKRLYQINVKVTHEVWHDLASSLKNTVGGTVAGK